MVGDMFYVVFIRSFFIYRGDLLEREEKILNGSRENLYYICVLVNLFF